MILITKLDSTTKSIYHVYCTWFFFLQIISDHYQRMEEKRKKSKVKKRSFMEPTIKYVSTTMPCTEISEVDGYVFSYFNMYDVQITA